jgi:tetratricopeptide (TPR) repeat protein
MLNPNPRDGEASYLLGLVSRLAGDLDGADDAFGKATWNAPWRAPASLARAELAAARGELARALELVDGAVAANPEGCPARGLRAALLRHLGRDEEARRTVASILADDPFDARAWHEEALLTTAEGVHPTDPFPYGAQTALDVAHDEARAGLFDEACDVLERALLAGAGPGAEALVRYTLGWLEEHRERPEAAARQRRLARELSPDFVFPARLEEIEVLGSAIRADPGDPRAPYYLGNLLYDRRRYHDAIRAWRTARRLDRGFPTVHRNLGIAEWNVLHRPEHALAAFERAVRADPSDARLLYELDQLRKRLGHDPADRLARLDARPDLTAQRDDLAVEVATLLNLRGRHTEALGLLGARRFHPWEGGEGLVSRQWVVANRELARTGLREGRPAEAIERLDAAMRYPPELGEGRHLLTREHELQLLRGLAMRAAGDAASAVAWLARAAAPQGDPSEPEGDAPYWRALALRELGRPDEARTLLEGMRREARRGQRSRVRIPFFATSLPTMLLFEDDLTSRARREARFLEGLALRGLGHERAAHRTWRAVLAEDPAHLEAALHIARPAGQP